MDVSPIHLIIIITRCHTDHRSTIPEIGAGGRHGHERWSHGTCMYLVHKRKERGNWAGKACSSRKHYPCMHVPDIKVYVPLEAWKPTNVAITPDGRIVHDRETCVAVMCRPSHLAFRLFCCCRLLQSSLLMGCCCCWPCARHQSISLAIK